MLSVAASPASPCIVFKLDSTKSLCLNHFPGPGEGWVGIESIISAFGRTPADLAPHASQAECTGKPGGAFRILAPRRLRLSVFLTRIQHPCRRHLNMRYRSNQAIAKSASECRRLHPQWEGQERKPPGVCTPHDSERELLRENGGEICPFCLLCLLWHAQWQTVAGLMQVHRVSTARLTGHAPTIVKQATLAE
jgi:hypothetical protein